MTTTGTGSDRQVPARIMGWIVGIHPTRRGLVLAWLAFTVMFGVLRVLTFVIHHHVEGFGDISAGGVHLHHYLWGILLLVIVGMLGLIERSPNWHVVMGLLFGVACALVVDEFALLLNLRDVYWEQQGRVSVDLALGIIGVAGTVITAVHFQTDRVENRHG